MKKILTSLIRLYQELISGLIKSNALPMVISSSCKFYPTCSNYAIESINHYGVIRGSSKAIKRILRCNPLFSPGIDLP